VVVGGVSVESNLTDWDQWVVGVRPNLCNIEDIEFVGGSVLFGHGLNKPVPGWIVTFFDSVIKVVSAVFRVLDTLSYGLGGSEVFDTLASLVMVLDIVYVTFIIYPSESVRGVTIHVSVAVGSSAVAEENGDLMEGFRWKAPEIEAHVGVLCVVGGIALLAVNKVGELNGILNEENRSVVADHVVVTFFGVVLNGEATRVTVAVVRATLTGDSWETKEDWSLLSDLVHELGFAEAK
jgi:hypothetical protein